MITQLQALEELILDRLPPAPLPARTPGAAASPASHGLAAFLGGFLVMMGILLSSYFGHPERPLTTQEVKAAVDAAVKAMQTVEAAPVKTN